MPLGVIFDMDGVLVDSEPFICKAAIMMFAEKGLTVSPDDFLPFVGAGEDRYLGGVAEKYNFPIDIKEDKRRTYQIYLQIIKGNLKSLPGAIPFLEGCRLSGKKVALATSADYVKMEGTLREVGLALNLFDAVVTGEDVRHKKPHPEIFLVAAERLGLKPEECLVVEDAVNGVLAARKSGARCLALATSFSKEELFGAGANWCLTTLCEASPDFFTW